MAAYSSAGKSKASDMLLSIVVIFLCVDIAVVNAAPTTSEAYLNQLLNYRDILQQTLEGQERRTENENYELMNKLFGMKNQGLSKTSQLSPIKIKLMLSMIDGLLSQVSSSRSRQNMERHLFVFNHSLDLLQDLLKLQRQQQNRQRAQARLEEAG